MQREGLIVANNCYFQMKVCGSKENVQDFYDMMKWQNKYKDNGVGRVFSCDCYEEYQQDNNYIMFLEGDCAWSIESAMVKDIFGNSKQNDIVSASKNLSLAIEAYSEECGSAFQEHFIIKNGNVTTEDCVDWNCYCMDEIETDEDAMRELLSDSEIILKGITIENYKDFIDDDGNIKVGDFEDWEWTI